MSEQLYKIGKVAELTGLSPERLRMWEQRHGIVPGKKVNRIRYYKEEQLRKLELMKRLIDQGYTIGELKDSTNEELHALLAGGGNLGTEVTFTPSIVLVGDLWNFERGSEVMDCRVVARLMSVEDFLRWDSNDNETECDAIVMIVSSLDVLALRDVVNRVDVPCVIIYRYASSADLSKSAEEGLDTHRFKESNWAHIVEHIRQIVVQRMSLNDSGYIFTDEELVHLTRCDVDARVAPQDIVELILQQRALVQHAQREVDSAFDIALVEQIRNSEVSLEKALHTLVDRHKLLV